MLLCLCLTMPVVFNFHKDLIFDSVTRFFPSMRGVFFILFFGIFIQNVLYLTLL